MILRCNYSATLAKVANNLVNGAIPGGQRHFRLEIYSQTFARVLTSGQHVKPAANPSTTLRTGLPYTLSLMPIGALPPRQRRQDAVDEKALPAQTFSKAFAPLTFQNATQGMS